jgi:two-component system, OmpR family, sensor histidine kinase MprB
VSLRARLTLGTAAALAVAIAIGLFAAYVVVRGQLRNEIDRSLTVLATPLVRRANQAPDRHRRGGPFGFIGPRTPATLGGAVGYFQSVSANGKTALPPDEKIHLPVGHAAAVATGTHAAYFTDATLNGIHLRIYTTRANTQTALEIARPLTEVDQALARIRLLFLFISLVAVAGAATFGLLISRATLRPVKRLTEDAERIAATRNLSERTDQNRSDELGRLAVAFNTMLDALTGSISAQRQLVADASHELRTPLTTIRTNLEVIELHDEIPAEERRRILAEATEELREMTTLIDELVELAHGDAQPITTEPTRLDLVAEEAVTAAARRSNHDIHLDASPTSVNGAQTALNRAITNLLDNAAKWSPPNAPIEVTVGSGAISVRDHGPGIDPADLPHVFDRFYRATAARTLPGSGLGLAIVRQIAEAHGGTITAEIPSGGGTLFTLRLPILAAENP